MSASAESLLVSQICQLARPLDGPADLRPLAERLGTKRFVALGEASHGTHDYYTWRGAEPPAHRGPRLHLGGRRG